MDKNMVVFLGSAVIGACIRRARRGYMALRKPEDYRALVKAEDEERRRRRDGAMAGCRIARKLMGK